MSVNQTKSESSLLVCGNVFNDDKYSAHFDFLWKGIWSDLTIAH